MSNRAKVLLLILGDLLILVLALTFVTLLRSPTNQSAYLIQHYQLFSIVFPFWLLLFFIEGLYSLGTYNPADLPISLIRTVVLSTLVSVIVIYLSPSAGNLITPKTNLVLIALTSFPCLYLWRRSFLLFFSKGTRQRATFLIGDPDSIKQVTEEIERKPYLGYRILPTTEGFEIPKETALIAVERNLSGNQALFQKIFKCLEEGIEVIDLANFSEKVSGKILLKSINESWFIEYCGHNESRSYDVLKSLIDRLVATLLIITLLPIFVVLIPVLLIFHGRPIFFMQTRMGLNNRPFKIYKLRTMVTNAEKDGSQWAKPQDARITSIGKILRKTRLDEIPQLINIFKGEMSLVGPRPEQPSIIEKHLAPNITFYNLRHLVKPGITGWAQVNFRYGFNQEDAVEKLQYDLFYVKNRSIWVDILVILKTIKTVITGAGH